MALMWNRQRLHDAIRREFADDPQGALLWTIDLERTSSGKRLTASYLGDALGPPQTLNSAAQRALRAYRTLRRETDLDVEVVVPLTRTDLCLISPDTEHEVVLFDTVRHTAQRVPPRSDLGVTLKPLSPCERCGCGTDGVQAHETIEALDPLLVESLTEHYPSLHLCPVCLDQALDAAVAGIEAKFRTPELLSLTVQALGTPDEEGRKRLLASLVEAGDAAIPHLVDGLICGDGVTEDACQLGLAVLGAPAVPFLLDLVLEPGHTAKQAFTTLLVISRNNQGLLETIAGASTNTQRSEAARFVLSMQRQMGADGGE